MKKSYAILGGILLAILPGVAHAAMPSGFWIYCGNLPGCPGNFHEYLSAALVIVANTLPKYVYAFGILFIMVGGGYMVLAAGREDWVTKGKNAITWSVIGIAVTKAAADLVNFLVLEVNTRDTAPDLPLSVAATLIGAIFDLLYVSVLGVAIYCGMWMVLSFGKEDNFNKAREGLFWCALGAIIINLAERIAHAFTLI